MVVPLSAMKTSKGWTCRAPLFLTSTMDSGELSDSHQNCFTSTATDEVGPIPGLDMGKIKILLLPAVECNIQFPKYTMALLEHFVTSHHTNHLRKWVTCNMNHISLFCSLECF